MIGINVSKLYGLCYSHHYWHHITVIQEPGIASCSIIDYQILIPVKSLRKPLLYPLKSSKLPSLQQKNTERFLGALWLIHQVSGLIVLWKPPLSKSLVTCVITVWVIIVGLKKHQNNDISRCHLGGLCLHMFQITLTSQVFIFLMEVVQFQCKKLFFFFHSVMVVQTLWLIYIYFILINKSTIIWRHYWKHQKWVRQRERVVKV